MKELIVRMEDNGQLTPVVELVRCKDCKYSEYWYGDKRRCFLWHESGIDVFNDGFCNYGEEKGAENG